MAVTLQPSQTAPGLTNSVSGNSLVLAWPADHTGYRLEVQTSNLANGVSTNNNDWTTVQGTTTNNSVTILLDKSLRTEFYRLVYP